jgi:hypothetical protein
MSLGAPQYWALLLALLLLSVMALLLVYMLRRVAPEQPGPDIWMRALGLILLGTSVAGLTTLQTGWLWRLAYAAASGVLVLGIGMLGEGLRRFRNAPSRMRRLQSGVLVAVVVALGFETLGQPLHSLLWMSAVAGLTWLAVGVTAWRGMRPGFKAIHTGLLLSAVVLAAEA